MNQQKFLSEKYLWLLLLLHAGLCLIAFNKAWTRSDNFLFSDQGDAMKNYFIMDSYLQHDSPKGMNHYDYMNYPFGDYVYYTDNTPGFCGVIKIFSHYIFDVTPWWLNFFHLLVALNILIAAWLTWLISKRFIESGWLNILLTLTIPWLNVQVTRIETTSNLSYSSLLLATIYLLIRLFESADTRKLLIKYWICLGGLISFSFFIHGYYIALLGIPVFIFHFWWWIANRKKNLSIKIIGALVPAVSILISYLIVLASDSLINSRAKIVGGYDWVAWRTNWLGLFTSQVYHTIKFPVSAYEWINFEAHNYMGAFVLYGMTFILLVLIAKNIFRSFLKTHLLKNPKGKLLSLLFITGFCSFIISLGNEIWWEHTGIRFYNVLNPFYWLLDYFPIITEFRTIGRFAWLLFFPATWMVAFLLEKFTVTWKGKAWINLICVVLVVFTLRDMFDTIQHLNNDVEYKNPLRKEAISKLETGTVNFEEYQCILPLPYFSSGADTAGYIIDPDNKWMIYVFQLSKKSDLPLMSGILGRSPIFQVKSIFNSLLNYKIDKIISGELNEKPILVAVNRDLLSPDFNPLKPDNLPAYTIYNNMKHFTDSLKMPLIFENENYAYYKWAWNKN